MFRSALGELMQMDEVTLRDLRLSCTDLYRIAGIRARLISPASEEDPRIERGCRGMTRGKR
jgi:hypothetical protein